MIFTEEIKISFVRQNSGKNEEYYLVRLDNARKCLSLVLAINCFSGTNQKRELMAMRDLNWDKITRHLGAKSTAQLY